ncbi:MAG: STAS domain-containing protein [Bacteroidetes bacterium]|nr:STAS domain-containing protein [Bacteroidota bacterium]
MSECKVRRRERDGITILELDGLLDAHTAPKLEQMFQTLLNDKKFKIIINCKGLQYISSAGLGVFMAYLDEVRNNDGDIKFSNMSPKIFNVFDLLGFPMLYEIYDIEEDALNTFRTNKR